MKLSDYLVRYLIDCDITHVFVVVGGASAHIIDSLGRNNGVDYVCVQHEQAAGMAADAYARITNNFGVAVVTSGPGAVNLLAALCCCWFDSIPCLFITGQVNRAESKNKRKVRQLGFQETDIVKIASSITKFAVTVKTPSKIKHYLDRALYIAKSGRPGPVLLDIPLDVQHAEINSKKLEGFRPEATKKRYGKPLREKVAMCLKLMSDAKRPMLLAGAGIRIGNATRVFKQFAESLGWPVVSTWSGIDLLPYDHPQYVGQIGIYGNRGANFAIQNSDLLVAIGARLDTRQTGGDPATFARGARKIVVDIDEEELVKGRVAIDVPVNFDVNDFLREMSFVLPHFKTPEISSWVARCREWKKKYTGTVAAYYRQKDFVNPYVFIDRLSSILTEDAVIVCDIGANTAWTMQAFKIKEGQRLVSALGFGPMGYGLGAAIGACLARSKANRKRQIVCILGDGGMQVNIQELQTIFHYKLPIKIFVLNNNSYGIIKQFQDTYFDSAYYATGRGYSCPDFIKIGKAYGILTKSIKNHSQLSVIEEVLKAREAVLCNVSISENQKIIPKLEAVQNSKGQYISKPIEDQWPYLDRDEFLENMIIDPMS